MERLIFVSSPYSGNVKENVANAKSYCKYVIDQGLIPFAPHLFFTQFLDDAKGSERVTGLFAGMEMLARCDEFWMFGDTISDGMRLELQEAIRLNKPIGIMRVEWEDAV